LQSETGLFKAYAQGRFQQVRGIHYKSLHSLLNFFSLSGKKAFAERDKVLYPQSTPRAGGPSFVKPIKPHDLVRRSLKRGKPLRWFSSFFVYRRKYHACNYQITQRYLQLFVEKLYPKYIAVAINKYEPKIIAVID